MDDWIIKADIHRLKKQLADAPAEERAKLITLVSRKESLLASREPILPIIQAGSLRPGLRSR